MVLPDPQWSIAQLGLLHYSPHRKGVAECEKMTQWITTTQVLQDLQTGDDALAWEQFCKHFGPVVAQFAKKLGMSPNDAEDAVQETMAAFFKAFREGKYNPGKGRLSNWLFGVAKRVILNLRGRQPLERLIADKATGTSFWDLVQDDHTIRQTWEAEWRQMVLQKCLAQIKGEFEPKAVRAFELYALSGTPVEAVCEELDMSRNAVYIAKSRVLSRLRELASQFE